MRRLDLFGKEGRTSPQYVKDLEEKVEAAHAENKRLRGEVHRLKGEWKAAEARVRELEAAIEQIDPTKLELLADWFDVDDDVKGRAGGGTIPALRAWAEVVRALDSEGSGDTKQVSKDHSAEGSEG